MPAKSAHPRPATRRSRPRAAPSKGPSQEQPDSTVPCQQPQRDRAQRQRASLPTAPLRIRESRALHPKNVPPSQGFAPAIPLPRQHPTAVIVTPADQSVERGNRPDVLPTAGCCHPEGVLGCCGTVAGAGNDALTAENTVSGGTPRPRPHRGLAGPNRGVAATRGDLTGLEARD